ncbi:DUF86 domain-containing protein [Gorillibacterium sp. sgz5001074]|uniref:DUF86 domain-containing protein n=1 Tax=Gorillibacterium sp. sgz5001074 TaxID=3446695 RepID=UPI003F67F9F9
MYFVNLGQIEDRLELLPGLTDTAERITGAWNPEDPVLRAALERVVHLALEAVTDIGSLLIDGFIMRDAASYEDIVDIMRDEKITEGAHADYLIRLVRLRRPLVQDVRSLDHGELVEVARHFGTELPVFMEGVRAFVAKETA